MWPSSARRRRECPVSAPPGIQRELDADLSPSASNRCPWVGEVVFLPGDQKAAVVERHHIGALWFEAVVVLTSKPEATLVRPLLLNDARPNFGSAAVVGFPPHDHEAATVQRGDIPLVSAATVSAAGEPRPSLVAPACRRP